MSQCGPSSPRALQAIVRAVDPHLDVEVTGSEDDWAATVVHTADASPEPAEVAITRFSGGAGFRFAPRRSLPLFPA